MITSNKEVSCFSCEIWILVLQHLINLCLYHLLYVCYTHFDSFDNQISDNLIFTVQTFKTSLTFKCLIEHLLADFSYSRPLDTYLWKQMMNMNRNITYKWCNIDKKHLLFTKRKCHKFPWLFKASRCSPRRRSICACRIACKVLVSIGL